MPRQKIARLLPPLPTPSRLEQAAHKTERLTQILRRVAIKNQRDQPRAFYSVREIAEAYRVPLSTVSQVYRLLEDEGLLTRVRSSRTLLQGRQFDRRLGVRAIVGLPASLSAFVTIQAYRMFFIRIRRELRLRGFATTMVFWEKREPASSSDFAERLKAYQVDTVIWFQPAAFARQLTEQLGDLGIRVIGVAHETVPSIPCRYAVLRDKAIRRLVLEWKERHAITEITAVRWKHRRTSTVEEALVGAVDELDVKTNFVELQDQPSYQFLASLQKTKTRGIVFASAEVASKLAFRAPTAMTNLLETHQVAFLNGPITMPFAKVPDAKVDLVVVDWQGVTEQIVDDLITQDAFRISPATDFEAQAKLRVPLSDFAQDI
jgi:DNA-binding transcriptional ArsR family regulator